MTDKQGFNRLIRRTAFLSVAFVAGLVFGIILLAGGDWIPGGIIVVAAVVGFGVQVPVIRRLCSEGPVPSPASSKPTGRYPRHRA